MTTPADDTGDPLALIATLHAERDAALAGQAAMAEVMEIINQNPGDLEPVFNAVLDTLLRLADAAFGSLETYHGGVARLAAARGAASMQLGIEHQVDPGSLMHRIVLGEDIVALADIRTDQAYRTGAPGWVRTVEVDGARTLLIAALRKEGRLLGFINIYRTEVRPFTQAQLALVKAFAAQVVMALDNARLLTEQREALERQTATAEVLQVINENPGNLVPVFDVILEKAHTLCGITMGALLIVDGDERYAVATRGYPSAAEELVRRRQPLSHWRRQLYARGEAVHEPDATLIDGVMDNPLSRAFVEQTGTRTSLIVPMRKEETLVGLITAIRTEVKLFSKTEIALLQSFAAQAVIAMENARLLNEQGEALEQQTATAEVLGVINANPGNVAPVFDAILQRAVHLCQSAFGTLFTFDGQLIHFAAAYGVTPETMNSLREPRAPAKGAPTGRIAEGEPFVHVLDATDQDIYRAGDRPTVAFVDQIGARTALFVGLRKDAALLGYLVIFRREVHAFSDKDIGLVMNFAAQAVIAMENARLLSELRDARDTAEASLIELKAAQANLIQAEKMASLGQLTAGIAHEIKNPLNFVNNFASLSVDLLDELKETAAPGFATLDADRRADIDDLATTLTGNLEKITEHGKRADGIVRSMLEHSRGASGERRAIDLNTLVEEALNLAYLGARAQDQSLNITLERDFAGGIAPIALNPQDVTRVLLNLVSNGFYAARKRQKATDGPYEPRLTVATRDLGDAVEIRVRDNGTGIPEDIREKLFQPFFTTKPTGEGTGLGLSITWDIVTKQHGGSITVDSEVGDFTEFTVTLPRQMTARDGDQR